MFTCVSMCVWTHTVTHTVFTINVHKDEPNKQQTRCLSVRLRVARARRIIDAPAVRAMQGGVGGHGPGETGL